VAPRRSWRFAPKLWNARIAIRAKETSMRPSDRRTIAEIAAKYEGSILEDWVRLQLGAPTFRPDLVSDAELREASKRFLQLLVHALREGSDPGGKGAWADVREMLEDLARARARRGFSPGETATFVFSLKQPIFHRLQTELAADAEGLAQETWKATELVDQLGLYAVEAHQNSREEVIARQQQELLELSTPVVHLWEGVLALPLIGILDSGRTQTVMESLLQAIVDSGASIAIIDITGVPTVDTLVAQHLLKTVSAARLMGADCIISGIRPQIAQTIVHLGIDLTDIVTKASLAAAFEVALARIGLAVAPVPAV
jgi:rsbT co-antagonist protein RsbR